MEKKSYYDVNTHQFNFNTMQPSFGQYVKEGVGAAKDKTLHVLGTPGRAIKNAYLNRTDPNRKATISYMKQMGGYGGALMGAASGYNDAMAKWEAERDYAISQGLKPPPPPSRIGSMFVGGAAGLAAGKLGGALFGKNLNNQGNGSIIGNNIVRGKQGGIDLVASTGAIAKNMKGNVQGAAKGAGFTDAEISAASDKVGRAMLGDAGYERMRDLNDSNKLSSSLAKHTQGMTADDLAQYQSAQQSLQHMKRYTSQYKDGTQHADVYKTLNDLNSKYAAPQMPVTPAVKPAMQQPVKPVMTPTVQKPNAYKSMKKAANTFKDKAVQGNSNHTNKIKFDTMTTDKDTASEQSQVAFSNMLKPTMADKINPSNWMEMAEIHRLKGQHNKIANKVDSMNWGVKMATGKMDAKMHAMNDKFAEQLANNKQLKMFSNSNEVFSNELSGIGASNIHMFPSPASMQRPQSSLVPVPMQTPVPISHMQAIQSQPVESKTAVNVAPRLEMHTISDAANKIQQKKDTIINLQQKADDATTADARNNAIAKMNEVRDGIKNLEQKRTGLV